MEKRVRKVSATSSVEPETRAKPRAPRRPQGQGSQGECGPDDPGRHDSGSAPAAMRQPGAREEAPSARGSEKATHLQATLPRTRDPARTTLLRARDPAGTRDPAPWCGARRALSVPGLRHAVRERAGRTPPPVGAHDPVGVRVGRNGHGRRGEQSLSVPAVASKCLYIPLYPGKSRIKSLHFVFRIRPRAGCYFGAIRSAPSKRITEPFRNRFSAMCTASAAYSSAPPRRFG